MKVREDGRSEAEMGQKRGRHAADFEAEKGAVSPEMQDRPWRNGSLATLMGGM